METIWLDGKTSKEAVLQRLDRVERLLEQHRDPPRPLRGLCGNHLVDALGCLAKCRLDYADRALDAAEKEAAATGPAPARRAMYSVGNIERIVRSQRASL